MFLIDELLSQDNLSVALDESKPLNDRVTALDNFEMVRTRVLFSDPQDGTVVC
jgi:hypothetical protein